MKRILKKTASFILILVYMAVASEVIIRVISSVALIYDIEMIRYAKELKIRSSLPGTFHQHKSNASAELMGVEISLNSLGHRNKELAKPKPAGEKRIQVLGSSIALGWGVPEDQTFSGVLEQRLNDQIAAQSGERFVVINAGIGNYNTHNEVTLFEEQVGLTEPDAVVLQYYINDAEPNPRGVDNPFLMRSVAAAFLSIRIRSLFTVGGKTLGDYYTELYDEASPGWRQTRNSIRRLKELTDQRGIPLVVLLVPELHDLSEQGPYPPLYKIVTNYLDSLGIKSIDPTSNIRASLLNNICLV